MADKKADVLLHPVRVRIITQLFNRQMTAQQIAKALLDVAQATLYRHINTLEDAGVIEVVAENQIRGTVEKTYAIKADNARLSPEDITNMSQDEHLHYFTLFAMTLIGDFRRMLDNISTEEETKWAQDTVRYSKIALYLADDEAQAMEQTITELMRKAVSNPPSPERQRYLLSLITFPDVDDSNKD